MIEKTRRGREDAAVTLRTMTASAHAQIETCVARLAQAEDYAHTVRQGLSSGDPIVQKRSASEQVEAELELLEAQTALMQARRDYNTARSDAKRQLESPHLARVRVQLADFLRDARQLARKRAQIVDAYEQAAAAVDHPSVHPWGVLGFTELTDAYVDHWQHVMRRDGMLGE